MGNKGAHRVVFLAVTLTALWLLAGTQPAGALTLRKADCLVCHVSIATLANTHHNSAVSNLVGNDCSACHGSSLSCQNCHNFTYGAKPETGKEWQQVHTAHLGQIPAKIANCDQCHKDGVPGGKMQEPYGGCANCHFWEGYNDPRHTRHTNVYQARCDTCHSASSCNSCHAQPSRRGLIHDIRYPGATGHDYHTNNLYIGCQACHTSGVPGGPMKAPFTGCADCHFPGGYKDPLHSFHTTRNSPCNSCHGEQGCNSCHDRQSSRGLIHDIRYPGAPGHDYHTDVQKIACQSCHTNGVPGGPMNAQFADCAGCHFKAGFNDQLHNYHVTTKGIKNCNSCHSDQPNPGCTGCHGVSIEFRHASQHNQVLFSGNNCESCHTGSLITIHERGANKPAYCNTCHLSTNQKVNAGINQGMAEVKVYCTDCHSVIHGVGNLAPSADAGPNRSATVGQAISFSGSGSTDADGTIVSYAWDFGDGTKASGVTVSKTYNSAGTFQVTLTVTDNLGAIGTATATVTVASTTTPPPPTGYVYADQVLRIENLKYGTYGDSSGSRTDITSIFKDGKLSDSIYIQNQRDAHRVVTMRVNTEARSVASVKLRVYVRSLYDGKAQTVRVYPYQSNGNDLITSSSLDFTVSRQGDWVELDVTSLKSRMDGYGWMKFRITCTSNRLEVAEGMFVH